MNLIHWSNKDSGTQLNSSWVALAQLSNVKKPRCFFPQVTCIWQFELFVGACASKNSLFSLQIQNLMLQTKITQYADRTLALHEIAFICKIQVNVEASNLKKDQEWFTKCILSRNNLSNQSCSLQKARENMCDWVTIGLDFTPDWIELWHEFFFFRANHGREVMQTNYSSTVKWNSLFIQWTNENSEKTVVNVSNTRRGKTHVTVSRGDWVWIFIWLIEGAIL